VSDGPGHVVPFRFELSSLVERSVASLYSHLVTRPTGQALRLGIESQIGEIGSTCLSVLDFAQVAFVDYSCADETVAKLIQRFLADDRPADAYFVVRGMAEHHREPIDAVLERHGLALVAETEPGTGMLLGVVSEAERAAWSVVERLGRADSTDVAGALGIPVAEAAGLLGSLVRRRIALRGRRNGYHYSLISLLAATS